jgi:phospho-N-acetylmuramoyl-pentapeptide-transferase
MFYHLIYPLHEYISFLRLFKYITFRSLFAAMTALIFVLIFGRLMIGWLRNLKFKEEIRELGPKSHHTKAGTPTMGGVIILSAVVFSISLWGNFKSPYLWLLVVATILLGALGFADDFIKSIRKKKGGVSARIKLICQTAIALGVALILYFYPSNAKHATDLFVPFVNGSVIDLGWIWVACAAVVIIGSTNAVNLTDGLDGLAVGLMLIVVVTIGLITYLTGNAKTAGYLRIPFIPGAAELTVFLAALTGACLGFLWFNSNPASVFMGDTGSLALGGVIGIVAVMTKKEILLFLLGGVFAAETISVIIQIVYYRFTKKRFFKMAPLHHHFELKGWPEQKVVARFWIVGIILALLGLTSLKIL